jgi:4-hydroxy 2-oxovalerate aldolase
MDKLTIERMPIPALLDCTFRDGGYYTSWDFPEPVVREYLHSMVENKIQYVEIGLRTLKNENFSGPHAFSKEPFLRSLNVHPSIKLTAMINTAELASSANLELSMGKLFPLIGQESKLTMVRLATHGEDMQVALEAADWLKERGFEVGLNIMQASEFSLDEMTTFAKKASQHHMDVLYFADSLGVLGPNETVAIIEALRHHWSGMLGVHMHDNRGLALHNSLTALAHGVTFVDSTVTGMGRGPGNVSTEGLLVELSQLYKRPVKIDPVLALINNYFKPMQAQCGWGKNTFYHMSALGRIHPTYVQNMLSDGVFSEDDILKIIDYLSKVESARYDGTLVPKALNFFSESATGNWTPKKLGHVKEILIIGSGQSTTAHQKAITEYANSDAVFVLALNANQFIDEKNIDLRVMCHPIRLLSDLSKIERLGSALVAPFSMMRDSVSLAADVQKRHDYGVKVETNCLHAEEHWAVIPNLNVGAYALAIASKLNPEVVSLVGFDGFGRGDPKQEQMQEAIDLFRQLHPRIILRALTPSSYNIKTASVYAL